MTGAAAALGRSGEQRVSELHVDRGYEVLARTWRCRDGELDLVVGRGRIVVF